MAKADQIKALIKSHLENDRDRFMTIAMQLAAHEAHQGHTDLAQDIRSLIDKSKIASLHTNGLQASGSDLLRAQAADVRLSELICPPALRKRIERILREYHQQEALKHHGLENRRKILLSGQPGTGKTMTAAVIASELALPLYVVQMDKLVTKFMGETSSKLRQIFDIIMKSRGVFLFDEFDAIGGERGLDNDVGEIRRVLNSFLQFIEQDNSNSIIVVATNNIKLLDQALFRRFDDVLAYKLPGAEEIAELVLSRLGTYKGKYSLSSIVSLAKNLSHAEITQACSDAIKETILSGKVKVTKDLLENMLSDRKDSYSSK